MISRNSFIVKQVLSLLLIVSLLVTPFASIVTPVSATEAVKVQLTVINDVYNETFHINKMVNMNSGDTALQVLTKGVGESNVGIIDTDYGPMITSINNLAGQGSYGWGFYVNDCMAMEGADTYKVSPSDNIEFRYVNWDSPPIEPEQCSAIEEPVEESPTEPKQELLKQIQQVIDEVSEQILANGVQTKWEAIGLALAEKDVPAYYLSEYKNDVIKRNGDLGAATNYALTILAIRALGGDPQDVGGYDLIEKLYNHAELTNLFNSVIYGLLALDSDDYHVPQNKVWSKEQLIQQILANQNNDGGWSWWGSVSDVDITGAVISALAPYAYQTNIKAAISRANSWLNSQQTTSGGFIAYGKESSESVSQAIIGLTANGIDPTGNTFSKTKGNALNNLLNFFGNDGSFLGEGDPQFPREQALLALNAYQYFLEGRGSIYDLRHIEIKESQDDLPPSSGGGSRPDPSIPGLPINKTVTLSVQGLNKQTLLSPKEVNLLENDTAFSVLLRELGSSEVRWTGSGATTYIQSIMGLAHFDHGPESGWNYSVDGYFPSSSAGAYRLSGGEHVRFLYTTDLGADVGNPSAGGSNPQTPAGVGTEVQRGLEDLAKSSIPIDNRLPIHAVNQTVQVLNSEKRMSEQMARQLQVELANNHVQLREEINKVDQENVLEDNKAEVKLVIPAHALPNARQISVTELNAGNRSELVSSIYEFLPRGTKFDQPVYISIKVPLLVEDLEDLALAWLDEETNQWIPIPAVVDAENGIITGQVNHFTKFAVVDKTKVTAYADDLHAKVRKAIEAIAQSEWRSGEYNLWEILGLYHLGEFSATDYLQHIQQNLEETKGEYRRVTDLSTAILGINLAGENPKRFAGIDLVNKLYNDPNITRQGTNGIIFSLITLEMTGLELPKDTLWTKDALIEWLLTNQHNNGSWSLAPNGEQSVDITAMAISSLAPYKDRKNVKQALDKATAWLASVQLEQGGFKYAAQHSESSESIAQVIIGLTANQINPLVIPFAKEEGNPLSALFEYQVSSGQYEHTKGEGADYIATEQALMALLAYDLYVEEGKSIFEQLNKKEQVTQKTKLPFTDQDLISAWALEAVEEAFEQQLMYGISADQFAPKEFLTRAQFTTLLLRLLEEESASGGEVIFDDVPLNAWYSDSVNQARELGIINGTSPTTFHPNKPVTRQEMAIMLANAFGLKNSNQALELVDLDEAWDEAQESIAAVYEHGIMAGVGNGQFAPRAQVTREMAAVVMVRLYQQQQN